jgi:hypothetical protein
MAKHDLNAKAVAVIRTKVDAAREAAVKCKDAARMSDGTGTDANANRADTSCAHEPQVTPDPQTTHVRFAGEVRAWHHLADVERSLARTDIGFFEIDNRVRKHIALTHGFDGIMEGNILVRIYHTVHVAYSSLDDLRMETDILRCNPNWYGKGARHDCALVSREGEPLRVVRIEGLLRCMHALTRRTFDVVLVRHHVNHAWRPKTKFRSCRVVKAVGEVACIVPTDLVRGALLCPAFGGPDLVYYIMDTIDSDMYLRLNGLSIPLNLHDPPEPPPQTH